MGVKVGAVSMTQHDHSATACRNVLTPHRLRLVVRLNGLAGCGKTTERLLFPEFLAAGAG
jgi:hypothetical protein